MKITLFLLLGALCLAAAKPSYEGFKVYRMMPTTDAHRSLLKSLESSINLDIWAGVRNNIELPVDIMVKPKDQEQFVKMINNAGMEAEIFIEDVQELINKQTVGEYARAGMSWTKYYNLDDIYSWMSDLAAANPGVVSLEIGGSTYENRQLKGVKISFGSGKKAVYIEGGIHAREWISPATVTYIINELLTSTDPTFRKIAESFDWYLFPVTNPDGFVYTHTNDRMWRKTRTNYSIFCKGADPNRNWDAHWMEQGSSSVCTTETYAGPSAFSEKCTKTISEYIKKIGSNLVAYIDFHSYSQLLMVPYGHTTSHLDNYAETVAIGKIAAKALASRYGTQYRVGNIAETIYPASGGSIDWVKQEFKTPLVYVYELRDTGRYGFILPPDQIIPNNLEIMDSLIAIFTEAEKMGIITLG